MVKNQRNWLELRKNIYAREKKNIIKIILDYKFIQID